jgi:hypothetical protein
MENYVMKSLLVKSVITLTFSGLIFGQGSRMGTSSSSQLQIVQGARHLSGGGAAANAVGLDAVYWNPAGLAMSGDNVEAMFSNRSYIADISTNYFGVGSNFGNLGKLALSVRTFNIGDINETTVYQPDGTGRVFTPSMFIVGGSVSKRLSDRTSVGATFNWLSESFGRVSANGMSVDIGVQYKSFMDCENLDVGFAIRNFGQPVTYGGEGLGVQAEAADSDRPQEYYKVDAASFDLPFTMDMSANYDMSGLNLGLTYTSNYYATDEIRLLCSYNVGELASVRAGYQTSMTAKKDDDIDWEYKNPFDGMSFGGSLNLQTFIGMGLTVDYAFMPAEYFDTNQVIALRVAF